MDSPPYVFLKQNNMVLRFLTVLLLSCAMNKDNSCSNHPFAAPAVSPNSDSDSYVIPSSLETLRLDGHLSCEDMHHAARDFGNRYHFLPLAVLHPKSVFDISSTIKHIFQMGNTSALTVAARGHGHSFAGQALAHQGVVINMESLQQEEMYFHTGELPYVDVSGGELWINILQESLKHGLAPKSWTDYLHLTVGGTLSYAGISGQAFRHGPQINNVYQLEVVTGTFKQVISPLVHNPYSNKDM